jgi:hypothetical protein
MIVRDGLAPSLSVYRFAFGESRVEKSKPQKLLPSQSNFPEKIFPVNNSRICVSKIEEIKEIESLSLAAALVKWRLVVNPLQNGELATLLSYATHRRIDTTCSPKMSRDMFKCQHFRLDTTGDRQSREKAIAADGAAQESAAVREDQ